MLLDLGLDLIDGYRMQNQLVDLIDLCRTGVLTVAVVDVDNLVAVLEDVGDTADETLGALGGSVDSHETEGTLGSRHCV